MPNIQSAKKALRQSIKRKKKNTAKKEAMKKTIKEIKKFLSIDKKEEALRLMPKAFKSIDKASKKGVIKKNNASRKKSRLANLFK